jgi:hypothetical protein
MVFRMSFHVCVGVCCPAFVCRNSYPSLYWRSKALIRECVRTHVILSVRFLLYICSQASVVLMLLRLCDLTPWSVFVWGLGYPALILVVLCRLAYSSVVLHLGVLPWSGMSIWTSYALSPSLDPLSRILSWSLDLGFINVLDNVSTISSVCVYYATLSDRSYLYVLVVLHSQIGVGTIRFASNRDIPSDMFPSVAPIGSQGQAHHITPSTT